MWRRPGRVRSFRYHGWIAAWRARGRNNRRRECAGRGCSLVDSGIHRIGRASNAVAGPAAGRVGPSARWQRCRALGLRTALDIRAGHSRSRSSVGRVGRHDFSWRCGLCVRRYRRDGWRRLTMGNRHRTDQQCRCQAGPGQPGAHSRPPMERDHSNLRCCTSREPAPTSDDPLVILSAVVA